MARILCFGDSITYGESDAQSGGWVEQLKQYFLRQHLGQNMQESLVYNLGIAGETTDGLENRFNSELRSRVSSKSKAIIILSYGYNDITLITDRFDVSKNRVPLEYFLAKIQTCVESMMSHSHQVIINNLIPFDRKDDGKQNFYGERRLLADLVRYNQALELLADNCGCSFLDLYKAFTANSVNDLLAKDGLHPNEKGHQLIFNRNKDLIDTLL
jgi:lysophospholipase L1-like esterase